MRKKVFGFLMVGIFYLQVSQLVYCLTFEEWSSQQKGSFFVSQNTMQVLQKIDIDNDFTHIKSICEKLIEGLLEDKRVLRLQIDFLLGLDEKLLELGELFLIILHDFNAPLFEIEFGFKSNRPFNCFMEEVYERIRTILVDLNLYKMLYCKDLANLEHEIILRYQFELMDDLKKIAVKLGLDLKRPIDKDFVFCLNQKSGLPLSWNDVRIFLAKTSDFTQVVEKEQVKILVQIHKKDVERGHIKTFFDYKKSNLDF